jgi:hypothetical protein
VLLIRTHPNPFPSVGYKKDPQIMVLVTYRPRRFPKMAIQRRWEWEPLTMLRYFAFGGP